MKDKIVGTICNNADKLAIGLGLLATGATCGILGYLVGKYDC